MASIGLDKVLGKAWADKSCPRSWPLRWERSKGFGDRDGELLQEAFGVKTIAEPTELKYVRWAQALAALDAAK